MADLDYISELLGGGADLLNFGAKLGFGISDRITQEQLNEQAQSNFERQFQANQQLNAQAQKNFENQMAFQKAQADLSQANWEKNYAMQKSQFEANRIGNLTKEYYEAGLNPFLAAGMGTSTAGVVGGGASTPNVGSANTKAHSGSANTRVSNLATAEMKLQNMNMAFQMEQQKGLNEASIKKINAEADLAEAQAEDILRTRDARIEKLQTETKLSLTQISEVIAKTNNIMKDTDLKDTENAKKQIEKEILENVKESEIEKAKAELKKLKTENRVMNAKEVREWVDMILSKFIGFGWLKK